jgi:hypothetical protein
MVVEELERQNVKGVNRVKQTPDRPPREGRTGETPKRTVVMETATSWDSCLFGMGRRRKTVRVVKGKTKVGRSGREGVRESFMSINNRRIVGYIKKERTGVGLRWVQENDMRTPGRLLSEVEDERRPEDKSGPVSKILAGF